MSSKKLLVADFFKTDLPAYGSYDNVRKIASYIDGMKNSQRKIIFTMKDKYSKDYVKSETLANVCAAYTNYLHGAANLGGVIDTMAQSFVGANNFPLLIGNSGGFGTRINPTCAASRYTRVALGSLVKTLLNINDDSIVGQQYFEGDYIEPKFFVPIFPVLFLNGSSGLSTGFSQDIYPRNPDDIIAYIKKKLSGTEKPRMALLPWFKGHKGKVVYNTETQRNESFGVVQRNNMTSYTITELPIGIEYQKYVEYLDKLCDNGTIQDYKNMSDTKYDTILFEIKTSREFTRKHENERKLLEVLHLVKSLPETLCCIDENGRVREFASVQDILDSFIKIRLEYYNLRKDYLLKTMKSSLEKLVSKYLFCEGIIKKTILVANVKKDDIVRQLEKIQKIVKIDNSYNYLLNMPIHSISKDTLEELKKQIKETKDQFALVKSTTVETMWTNDLVELKKMI